MGVYGVFGDICDIRKISTLLTLSSYFGFLACFSVLTMRLRIDTKCAAPSESVYCSAPSETCADLQ